MTTYIYSSYIQSTADIPFCLYWSISNFFKLFFTTFLTRSFTSCSFSLVFQNYDNQLKVLLIIGWLIQPFKMALIIIYIIRHQQIFLKKKEYILFQFASFVRQPLDDYTVLEFNTISHMIYLSMKKLLPQSKIILYTHQFLFYFLGK